MDLIICLRNRKQTLTMNSTLTVYLVSEHLSVDHPVGHVEDVTSQSPGGLLIWVQDSLASYSKAHQNHKHDDHKVQHVNHLQGEITERLSAPPGAQWQQQVCLPVCITANRETARESSLNHSLNTTQVLSVHTNAEKAVT